MADIQLRQSILMKMDNCCLPTDGEGLLILELVKHLPGELNGSVDMCTGGRANLEDMGPEFLKLERCQWPLSCDFCNVNLPREELRSNH